MSDYVIAQLRELQQRVSEVKVELHGNATALPSFSETVGSTSESIKADDSSIYDALCNVSQSLASSYAQVRLDLEDTTRIAWGGTAHEIREILRSTLEHLAPDDAVMVQPWFKPEKESKGPTQKQRALFILRKKKVDSTIMEVAAQIDILEEMIAKLIRSLYGRASDAAHGAKDRREARRILNYFEAFMHDLLDVP